MADNSIGYVGVNGSWKGVTQRYIGIDSSWYPEYFKWIGKNGYWRVQYIDATLNRGNDLYAESLNGWTWEPENSVIISGGKFLNYRNLSTNAGGLWVLESNLNDTYENFINANASSYAYTLKDYEAGLEFLDTSSYLALPTGGSGFTGRGLLGNDGLSSYCIGGWLWVPGLPTGTDRDFIFSTGTYESGSQYWLAAYIDSSGAVNIEVKSHSGTGTFSLGTVDVSAWNKIYLNRYSSMKLYLNDTSIVNAQIVHPGWEGYDYDPCIYIGSGYAPGVIGGEIAMFNSARTSGNYTIQNSSLGLFKPNSTAQYQTARLKPTLEASSGRYYVEASVNVLGGVMWMGVGEPSFGVTAAAGIVGWSFSSIGRKFNHQTGGGTTWLASASWGSGDNVGMLYDSCQGTLTMYKNGVLKGTPWTSAAGINGDLEIFFCIDTSGNFDVNIDSSSWRYPSVSTNMIDMPSGLVYGTTYQNYPNSIFKNFYAYGTSQSEGNIQKLLNMRKPALILEEVSTLDRIELSRDWILDVDSSEIAFTVPPNSSIGLYSLIVQHIDTESVKFPANVINVTKRDTSFNDDFTDVSAYKINYLTLHKAWGGANGGVVRENVLLDTGNHCLRLYANGDLYTGDVQGVDNMGEPKYHTDASDPQIGLPWKNRVGGAVIFNEKTGYGSYRVTAKIPPLLGVASAFWTFFYNEIYPQDPRWNDFTIDESLHQQGSEEDGYYCVRNHEIDIEFPSHKAGGNVWDPSLANMKCNTWRGELQNWDVPITDPSYWEEYRDELAPIGFNAGDSLSHIFRIDWHNDRVEFYVDSSLKKTIVNTSDGNTIPDIPGHFTFGVWFPSSALTAKPWLVDPSRGWAGGTKDTDGGQKAMWTQQEMTVTNFSFTPFDEVGERLKGETYPFGGYRMAGS